MKKVEPGASVAQYVLTERLMTRCAVAMLVEQWLEEMDKRCMVLNAGMGEVSSAL